MVLPWRRKLLTGGTTTLSIFLTLLLLASARPAVATQEQLPGVDVAQIFSYALGDKRWALWAGGNNSGAPEMRSAMSRNHLCFTQPHSCGIFGVQSLQNGSGNTLGTIFCQMPVEVAMCPALCPLCSLAIPFLASAAEAILVGSESPEKVHHLSANHMLGRARVCTHHRGRFAIGTCCSSAVCRWHSTSFSRKPFVILGCPTMGKLDCHTKGM